MCNRLLALVFALSAWAPAAVCAAPPAPSAAKTRAPSTATSPAPATTKTLAPASKDAPADQYFGSFGMSPLSIRSSIGFLGRQYHYRTISDHDLLRRALMTESALRVWRARYPEDSWLAPTFFHLEQLYQAVQTEEAHKHATAILKDVARYYPDTKYGHLSRARLAAGFPPLVPESPLVATPAPGTPSSPNPGESASPAAGAPGSESPAPGASGTPQPGASGTPQPGASASGPPVMSPASPSPAPSASPK